MNTSARRSALVFNSSNNFFDKINFKKFALKVLRIYMQKYMFMLLKSEINWICAIVQLIKEVVGCILILTRAMLAEAHCMQHQKYKLIAKTSVIYHILIRLTQLYYELCRR